jgi:hypothetical protein
MSDDHDPIGPARALLADGFGRIRELASDVVDGSKEHLSFRADASANTVAWLVWHAARQEDLQIAHLGDVEQAWVAEGWPTRFGHGLGDGDMGYGDSVADVARLDSATAELLTGYHEAVHARTTAYLDQLDRDELERVVDASYDPPVTVAGRLVSIVSDGLQHLGQAAYVKGLADRAR